MPYITVDGQRLFYLRRGAAHRGTSILLLHGAGGHALLWAPAMAHISQATSIALDLPGHGRSAAPSRTSIGGYSEAVLAVADALQLDDLALAGHSMGGAIALEAALRAPGRFRALVLISVTARLFVAPALLAQLVEDPARARQWIVDTGYGPATGAQARQAGARQLAEVAPGVLHSDFVACSVYDARPRLAEVRCPALVLYGSEDRLTPPRYVRALQEGLPAARLEEVPGAGHMLPLERPEAVGEAISRFLAALARPSPSV